MTEQTFLFIGVLLLISFALGALISHRSYTAGANAGVAFSESLKNDKATLDLITAAKDGIPQAAFDAIIEPVVTAMATTSGVLTQIATLVPALADAAAIFKNYNEMLQKGIDDIPNDRQVKPLPLTIVRPQTVEPAG